LSYLALSHHLSAFPSPDPVERHYVALYLLQVERDKEPDVFSLHCGFSHFRHSRVTNSTAVGQFDHGCDFQPIIFGAGPKNDITVDSIRTLEKTYGQFGSFWLPYDVRGSLPSLTEARALSAGSMKRGQMAYPTATAYIYSLLL
jgi:hypothetical protein